MSQTCEDGCEYGLGGQAYPAPQCLARAHAPPCLTLMAFREPLKSMLCEETSVHTGLSWARIVFTFCRFWISHTWQVGGQEASGTSPAAVSPGPLAVCPGLPDTGVAWPSRRPHSQ